MGVFAAMTSSRDIKPWFRDDIFNVLLSVARAAGKDVHPEFIRALIAIGYAVGISEDELRNGKLKG